MPGSRRSRVLAVLLAAALSLTGCTLVPLAGTIAAQASAKASAKGLWDSTLQMLAAARSARVKGTVSTPTSTQDLEIVGTRDGTNSWTRFTTNGATGEVIILGDVRYTKGDAAFWKSGGVTDELAAKIGTKYVKASPKKAAGTKSIGDEIDVVTKATALEADMFPFTVENTVLNGRSVYLLTRSLLTYDQNVWIAADGTGELLRFQQPGTTSIDLTFSEWDTVLPWTTPPADQVYSR
jgi:hypothetical protein